MNFEKPLEGGGELGWIRISTESARLHYNFRHSAMVSITEEIHVIFIK